MLQGENGSDWSSSANGSVTNVNKSKRDTKICRLSHYRVDCDGRSEGVGERDGCVGDAGDSNVERHHQAVG